MKRNLIDVPEWINIIDANVQPGAEYWHLKQVEYWNDQKSGGTHHIYAGEPHDPSVSMEVSNGQDTWTVALDKPNQEPAGNFAMWGGNTYSAKLEGPSDVIEGMHMPQKQHVSFILAWERTIKGADQEASGDLDSLENKLRDSAETFAFPLYKDAALFKFMKSQEFTPCSPEFTVSHRGEAWIAQVGKQLATDEENIFFVLSGDWDNIRSIKKKVKAVFRPLPSPIDRRKFIQRQDSDFILNNRPFRFVGANIRGLIHYGHGAPLRVSRREHVHIQLQAAREMGARVIRVFGANRHASVKQIAERLKAALQWVEAHNMYLIFAFTDVHHDTAFNVPGDERFYQDNRLDKAWYDGGYRENYLPFVEQIVTRFKEHKRIFAWELGNELKARDGQHVLPELFIQFASHVSDRIREIDANHLITTGIINSENLGCNNEQAERLYRLPNLDFMTAHVYHSQSANQWLTLEARRAGRDVQRAKRLKMPFIIEEIGFEGGDRVAQTEQHLKKWLRSKMVSGFMQWGLMATSQDMGDGDGRFGIHGNQPDFSKIVRRFKEQAQALLIRHGDL